MCCFSPYCCHTTQTMVIKAGKNDHLCWDGSTTIKPTNMVMNQVTPVIHEAPITFGHTSNCNCTLTYTIPASVTQHLQYFWLWLI
jgi:hypothetical protein